MADGSSNAARGQGFRESGQGPRAGRSAPAAASVSGPDGPGCTSRAAAALYDPSADRDSGDEVTFTFAEMAELDQVMAAGFRGSQAVVLLTADGGTWAAGVTGPDAIVSQLLPMGKHMVAVMAWMEWSGHGAEVRATRLARVGLD